MDKLWVDKYRPKQLDLLDYHQNLTEYLKKLAKAEDFPHLLFYGKNGAGKKTRVLSFLHEVYGPGITKLKSEIREFKSDQNTSSAECNIISSNFHLDLTPSEAENNDLIIIQKLIKEVASTHQLDSKSQRQFKVIVINEADKLSRKAQAALRRIMEKYMSKCRLILVCENIGRLITPLKSRCLGVRVPSPSVNDIESLLKKICRKENKQANPQLLLNIANQCERNIRKAILQFQIMMMRGPSVRDELHIPEWRQGVSSIASDIIAEQSPTQIKRSRDKVYDLLVNCIPPEMIVKYLLTDLLFYIDNEQKFEFIYWAAYHENKMQLGSKPIFHIEALIARLSYIYKKFNSNMEII